LGFHFGPVLWTGPWNDLVLHYMKIIILHILFKNIYLKRYCFLKIIEGKQVRVEYKHLIDVKYTIV
jgi:hypothetical protein